MEADGEETEAEQAQSLKRSPGSKQCLTRLSRGSHAFACKYRTSRALTIAGAAMWKLLNCSDDLRSTVIMLTTRPELNLAKRGDAHLPPTELWVLYASTPVISRCCERAACNQVSNDGLSAWIVSVSCVCGWQLQDCPPDDPSLTISPSIFRPLIILYIPMLGCTSLNPY